MYCVIRWNAKLQQLDLYTIAPIRERGELLTYYGRGYWLAILHTFPSGLQREAILAGQLAEVETFTGLQAERDVREPAITRNFLRLTPVLKKLRGGVPPLLDY